MEMSRLRDARRGKYDHAQPNNPGAPPGYNQAIAAITHQPSLRTDWTYRKSCNIAVLTIP